MSKKDIVSQGVVATPTPPHAAILRTILKCYPPSVIIHSNFCLSPVVLCDCVNVFWCLGTDTNLIRVLL